MRFSAPSCLSLRFRAIRDLGTFKDRHSCVEERGIWIPMRVPILASLHVSQFSVLE